MKKPLQAILIAGEKMKEEVLSGKKKITVREGLRDYVKGGVLIGCHILNWATMKNITNVVHTKLRDVTEEEFRADGYSTKQDMLDDLKNYYPQIKWGSPVTIVTWE